MTAEAQKIGVLCVDDNPQVAEALRLKLTRTAPFEWIGWLPSADRLRDEAVRSGPAVVLLDLDMPGRDPFAAAADVASQCPASRIVIFSGHVRAELVQKAFDAGVWGYVSKNDGEDELLLAMRRVASGEIAMSPEVRSTYDRL